MQLRPEVQIASAIKAMKDVVIPAIAPDNSLAVEQGRLVVGMLALMAHQLPLQFAFDRDELARLLVCADRLDQATAACAGLAAARGSLDACRGEAATLLRACAFEPADLLDVVQRLKRTVAGLVDTAAEIAEPAVFAAIGAAILDQSREQLIRDRALMAPQGWEPDPAALPPIADLLATDMTQSARGA
ncbi:hypothetical protein D3874_22590 [Oleomonas cavernae]|uniref:Uncharacterized protein n=1 Tax=Oleomonas cavernae TaxID=2320859 RepID=A0A418WHE4_9PROT|nr:hypothetical protein [Oleomonas cavernae]RJF89415.1 hypothetical protein D3874_22590 [Oleomonas cavernae]